MEQTVQSLIEYLVSNYGFSIYTSKVTPDVTHISLRNSYASCSLWVWEAFDNIDISLYLLEDVMNHSRKSLISIRDKDDAIAFINEVLFGYMIRLSNV